MKDNLIYCIFFLSFELKRYIDFSIQEVWLNSQRKSVNISHMEDITSQIEAGLKTSENPYHPENPEGSIIKVNNHNINISSA